jgi:peptidyl-prolyl cis-trans isomerase B (cyclophilin B)
MIRTCLALFACAAPVLAQDIPGVRATLLADPALVSGGADVTLKLTVDVQQAAELPADVLAGVSLDVVSQGNTTQIREGKRDGTVSVGAGARIERTIKLPITKLLPAGAASAMASLQLQWPGFHGANCVVQIAPDLSKVDIDSIDLQQTKVVLITNYGDMTLAFYPAKAPETVKNFVKLAKEGFYDGTKFHRVIRNFMIQGGDPFTKDDSKQARWGQGDPGYKIKGEVNDTKHKRGVISMANSGTPDTAGSQFFICHVDAEHLDRPPGYTAFGALEAGLDVLDKIANVACGGQQKSTPLQPVVLKQAVVLPVLKK